MILTVSGRTDIVAFYSDWFFNRYKEGFVDVRNPFNQKMISRIFFKDVDLIMFCTKNPMPILDRLHLIKEPIEFHITLTSYKKDIEPNVPRIIDVIEGIKKLAGIIGKEAITIRYDPIFISERYNLDYHLRAFEKICELLDGYASRILISFMDEYKNVQKNRPYIKDRPFTVEDYKAIGIAFSNSAKKHHMEVFTCFEENNLVEYGFSQDDCLSSSRAYMLTGKKYPEWKARKERKCHCVQMVDIGVYNSCKHLCRYCYANFQEDKIHQNFKNHDPNSSLLVGHILEDDIIKVRTK